jgi:hypothetical protein
MKDTTDKKIDTDWDKRCLAIAEMADKGDDDCYGKALFELRTDIKNALQEVRREKELIEEEIKRLSK